MTTKYIETYDRYDEGIIGRGLDFLRNKLFYRDTKTIGTQASGFESSGIPRLVRRCAKLVATKIRTQRASGTASPDMADMFDIRCPLPRPDPTSSPSYDNPSRMAFHLLFAILGLRKYALNKDILIGSLRVMLDQYTDTRTPLELKEMSIDFPSSAMWRNLGQKNMNLSELYEGRGMDRMDLAMSCLCMEMLIKSHVRDDYPSAHVFADIVHRLVGGGVGITKHGFENVQDFLKANIVGRLLPCWFAVSAIIILYGIISGQRPRVDLLDIMPTEYLSGAIMLLSKKLGGSGWLFNAIENLQRWHRLTPTKLMSIVRDLYPMEYAKMFGEDDISADLGDLGI